MQRMLVRRPSLAVPFVAAALAVTAGLGAQSRPADRFTAFAVDIGSPGRASSGVIEIVIERYSSEGEWKRLLTLLREKGADALLDTLRELPRVGYFRAPGTLGWDIKFARKVPGEDGGETISLLTDRYISFWEATYRPRTIDYPFTLIELHVGPGGKGEGKMSLATKVVNDGRRNTVVLEDYKSQPVLLNQVKRESSTQ